MKQVIQSNRTGVLGVAEVPVPLSLPGALLVRTSASLVSAGTERQAMALAQKSLAGKARERPDLVQKVVEKVGKDGVIATAQSVFAKLDAPAPLGYSVAGTVLEVGAGVHGFAPGDRVACAGAGVANHAEVNCVPVNLCARIPSGVGDDAAAFVTLGAIALHGVRTARLTLGERVAVIGLGLLGQLAVQLCRASGCQVVGVDLDPAKLELARRLGAERALHRSEDVEGAVMAMTAGRGVDAVLVCAASSSNDPVELAGAIARDRARVVVVGAVSMNVPRRPYYDKELSFFQSRSYGPGRYDPSYEEQGVDYPLGYVRWTEGRNFEAFLNLCASGQLQVAPLISHRFAIAEAEKAYELISGEAREPFLGVLLTYPQEGPLERTIELPSARRRGKEGRVRVSVVGAGAFATSVLLPALNKVADVRLETLVSARGISARHHAEKLGFARASTDEAAALEGPGADAVVISTRHDLHADQVSRGLRAGKAVFVEKPLAIDREGLESIVSAAKESGGLLTVDFNRRFAPLLRELREFFSNRRQPMVLTYRVNAGQIPHDSWIHDPSVGGGRIIGEVCHFIDACAAVTGSEVARVYAEGTAGASGSFRNDDQLVVSLRMEDGSVGTVIYTSGGDATLPKERLEVDCGGASAVLDDFRSLSCTRSGKTRRTRSLQKDKGHRAALEAFIGAVRGGGGPPISLRSMVATSIASLGAAEALGTGQAVDVTKLVSELLG